jgi:signal transduction histidine kinase/CheY-like chemotaxis protein
MRGPSDPFASLPQPKAKDLPGRLGNSPTQDQLRAIRIPPLPTPPPCSQRPRILIIDDEPTFLEAMRAVHENTELSAHAVLVCEPYQDGDYSALLARIKAEIANDLIDAVVIDLNLIRSGTRTGGLGLLQRLRDDLPEIQFIPTAVMTGHVDPELQRRSAEEGIDEFIIKLDPQQTAVAVSALLPYRFVTELPRWQSAATERFWQNLSGLVSSQLTQDQSIDHISEFVSDRLSNHFGIAAVYVRELKGPQPDKLLLVLRGSADGLGVGPEPIPLEALPVHKQFLESGKSHDFFGPLTAADLGAYASRASGRRLLAARMSVRNEIIGIIALYRREEDRPFSRLDGMMAQLLAQQLGAAIFQERLIDELRGRQNRLPKILAAFVKADDERMIFALLQESVHIEIAEPAAPGRVMTTIRALEPGTQDIPRQATSSGIGATIPEVLIYLSTSATVAEAIRTGKSSLNNDVRPGDPGFVFTRGGERAHITVPLRSDQVCFGAICIESLDPDVFSDADLPFAETLCGAATEAIIRLRSQRFAFGMARLLGALTIEKYTIRNNLLEQAVELLFEFTGFAELLYLVPPPDESQREAAWQIREVFGRKGERYGVERLRSWQQRTTRQWADTFIYKSLQLGAPIDFTDDESQISDDSRERDDNARTKSQANLLIRIAGDEWPRAIISLLFLHPLSLSRHHLALLEEFATVLARLLDQEKSFGSLLVELMLREQNARIGLAYHQLRHVLVNKLGGIRELIKLQTTAGKQAAEIKDQALAQLDEVGSFVNRANNVVKVPEILSSDLQRIWRRVQKNLLSVASNKHSNFGEGRFEVANWPTDAAILETILYNLADNALAHGGGGITIDLHVHSVEGGLALDVSDTGHGIPARRREAVFMPGATTQTGTAGLGLYMSQNSAKDLGGDLTLLAETGRGTTFRITLPNATKREDKL